ncbi:hypothetical protein ACCAA_1050031 [Candidatus Accumulibacter aalborgensis]|uniref:Uncharacterized protein n=1 Tax=Candidatus Accumulibacter aalborgensis TaxID=1860102 RepID=A0A1A8XFN8_9PROT|nr:hypothetical protein ACCAA_1050031 [Candidatus Accumulibacter aalborgensis]
MHYHRRAFVSRSCSGWEGVGPKGYGRQAKLVRTPRGSGVRWKKVWYKGCDCFDPVGEP